MKLKHGIIFASFGVGVACGGGTAGTPGGNGADASASSSSSGGASGSGSSGGGASSGMGGSSGAGGGTDAATTTVIPPGTMAGTGTIPCGGTMCTAPDVCCNGGGGGGGGGPACSTLAACMTARGSDTYTCAGPANCAAPNNVCCVTAGMGRAGDVAVCQATCNGRNTARVCQTAADCPTGMDCRAGGAPAGILLCQPPLIPTAATPGTGTVTCGMTTCNAPNVCCDGNGLNCDTLMGCDGAGNNSYTCTGQANCAAPNICCLLMGGNGGGQNDIAVCQATCPPGNGGNNQQVCQTSAECTTGMVCRAGAPGVPGGITTCRPPMPDAGTTTTPDAAMDVMAPPPDTGTAATDAPSGG